MEGPLSLETLSIAYYPRRNAELFRPGLELFGREVEILDGGFARRDWSYRHRSLTSELTVRRGRIRG